MVSLSANVKLSPGGILFLTLIGIVLLLYVKDKLPSSNISFPTDIIKAALSSEVVLSPGIQETNISLKHLLAASLYASEMGGRKLLQIRKNKDLEVKSKGKTLEGANDPVTEGDIASHRIMFGLLKQQWPRLNIVSEEKDTRKDDNHKSKLGKIDFHYVASVLKDYKSEYVPVEHVTVWIDPLDATQEFTENLMKYVTTMVCIAVNGTPVAGVIHQPSTGMLYWGWVHHGHSDFGQHAYTGSKVRLIVSRSHAGSVNKTAAALFQEPFTLTSAGGAGYKAVAVALGDADLYAHVTAIKKWDICAGSAILKAIGGEMSDLQGMPIDFSLRTPVVLHSGLLASLKNHKKYVSYFKKSKV